MRTLVLALLFSAGTFCWAEVISFTIPGTPATPGTASFRLARLRDKKNEQTCKALPTPLPANCTDAQAKAQVPSAVIHTDNSDYVKWRLTEQLPSMDEDFKLFRRLVECVDNPNNPACP